MSYWVIDANIAIQTALDITDSLEHFWARVDKEQITPCAPRLWLSETTSAIRFLLSQKEITPDEAEDALRERFLSQFVANFNMRRMLAI